MTERPFYFTWSDQVNVTSFKVASASDGFFKTPDGIKIYDCLSTSSQALFGHSNQKIKNAIKDQVDNYCIMPPKGCSQQRYDITHKLLDILELDGKIFYTVSGSESVENALKMARQVKDKKYVLARSNSYHGATLGALSVTGDWRNKAHLTLDEYTVRIPEPHDDPDSSKARSIIEEFGPEKFAAICLETVSGTNGVVIASKKWWDGIQKICKDYDIFLIIDEVFCGFGRTGKNFGFQHYGIKPDFITMSKAITGGYVPFGAVWTSNTVFDFYKSKMLSCGLTNYAHPLGLAAMNAVIDELNLESTKEKLVKNSFSFKMALEKLKETLPVKEVRQIGFLAAIDFEPMKHFHLKEFLDNGIYLYCKNNSIILAPPIIWEESHYEEIFEKIVKTIKDNYYED